MSNIYKDRQKGDNIGTIEKQVPKKPRKTGSYRGLINKIYAYACLERWANERQETMYC